MIDLHTHIAGGVRSVEDMELYSVELMKRGAGVGLGAEAEMYLGGDSREHIDSCLYICGLVLQDEVVVRSQGSGVESGDVDGLGACIRTGYDAIGTLLDAGPQTALEERGDSLFGGDVLRLGKIEFGIFRFLVSLDSDFEKFSLLSSDNFADCAAHR